MISATLASGSGRKGNHDLDSLTRQLEEILQPYVDTASPMNLARSVSNVLIKVLSRQRSVDGALVQALARGVMAKQETQQEEGGHISTEQAARLLNLSKTTVLQRYEKGQLLGWREPRQKAVRFPIWQFTANGLLPGLEPVLAILEKSALDEWGKILFFLQKRDRLNGLRPLDLLRQGKGDEVQQLAWTHVG